MAQIHSTYNANTGTSTAIGMTVSNVVVPSVVDGMLVLCWGVGGPPTLDVTFGSGGLQVPTKIRGDISGALASSIQFLPRPDVGTYDLAVSFGGTSRGSVFVVLLTGTKPTGYTLGTDGGAGTSSILTGGPVGGGTGLDIDFSLVVYSNRDSAGPPSALTGSAIHNTIINSGGGVNSYGFAVSTQAHSNFTGLGWTTATLVTGMIEYAALLNSDFNAPGTLTIRHAP